MPYIKQSLRSDMDEDIRPAEHPGELNYQLTQVILAYLEENGLRYHIINDIIGALEQAKDEFRRRVVHPYEDQKKNENGDVYPVVEEETNATTN